MSSKMYVVRLCCRCYWRYVFQWNALKFHLTSLGMVPRASQTARYTLWVQFGNLRIRDPCDTRRHTVFLPAITSSENVARGSRLANNFR